MPSLVDPVERWAGETPDAVALRAAGGDLSYATLLDAVRRFAAVLGEWGVRRGDRVLLLAPAVPEFVVAYLAIQAAGAVLVPMNTVATKDEITYVLQDSGARCVLAWHERQASREAAEAASVQWHPLPERVWLELGDVFPTAVVVKDSAEPAVASLARSARPCRRRWWRSATAPACRCRPVRSVRSTSRDRR